jgi:UDP-GlcNAc:undecaprenyl-phosphate GlcNAc-1-phosphate transferase
MGSIVAIFIVSFTMSLVLTPLMRRGARNLNLMDLPSKRKVHTDATPRAGGVAIYLAFFLSLISSSLYSSLFFDLLVLDTRIVSIILGASLVFGLGLLDDVKRLGPWIKFTVQGIAALIAFVGGMKIGAVAVPGMTPWILGWLSLPATIFWFLLIINAINLIDGLDGLAAGVSFFTSMVLLVMCVSTGNFLLAMTLAALGGAALGFLRYNFNPASIFMGDCGSYFLGYMLASLSILGSLKSPAVVAILIPIIALGLPLMDLTLATIRRFVFGVSLFSPDREHIHHKLLQVGYTPRRAAILLYSITVALGAASLFIFNARAKRASFILGGLGIFLIFSVRKLGYLEYFTTEKILGWVADITDEAGMTRARRTFLSHQLAVSSSENIYQFWYRTVCASERLKMDKVCLNLNPDVFGAVSMPNFLWENSSFGTKWNSINNSISLKIPLISDGKYYGVVSFDKSLNEDTLDRHVLHRVEHFRRTITRTLQRFSEESHTHPEVIMDRRQAHSTQNNQVRSLTESPKWDGEERRKFVDQTKLTLHLHSLEHK